MLMSIRNILSQALLYPLVTFFEKSQPITRDAFERLMHGAQVLEFDQRGVKVVRLQDQTILKVFRIRSQFSSACLFSYARRFVRNARRLKLIGIESVQPITLFHFIDAAETAVLYSPLQGVTVKEMLKNNTLDIMLACALVCYVAKLHDSGIYFRSLHMGNIILTDKKIGLIDISDLSIYSWGLFYNTRARNFKRITRYNDDMVMLGDARWNAFLEGYFQSTQASAFTLRKLRQRLMAN